MPFNCMSFKRNGFFIEAGALNGEKGSNSLSLEADLGWSGLLAEGDPLNIELVKYVCTGLSLKALVRLRDSCR